MVSETPTVQLDSPGIDALTPNQNDGQRVQVEQQEYNDKMEIDSILNSLSHRTILQRHTVDRRIKSTLLPSVTTIISDLELVQC